MYNRPADWAKAMATFGGKPLKSYRAAALLGMTPDLYRKRNSAKVKQPAKPSEKLLMMVLRDFMPVGQHAAFEKAAIKLLRENDVDMDERFKESG